MSLAHTQAPTGSLCHSLLWLSIFTLYTVQYTVLARLKTLSLGSQRRRHDDAFSPGLHHCRLYRLWQISPLHIDHWTLIIVIKNWLVVRWDLVKGTWLAIGEVLLEPESWPILLPFPLLISCFGWPALPALIYLTTLPDQEPARH